MLGRKSIITAAERFGHRWLVVGPSWGWGDSYASLADAEQAIATCRQPAYGYTLIGSKWRPGLV